MPTSTPATRDYQRAQVALRALTYKDITRLWALLDVEKLDDTFPRFAAATMQVIRQRRDVSASFARSYLASLRAGVPGDLPAVDPPSFRVGDALTDLRFASVVSIKVAMTRGTPLDRASRNALVRTMGVADRHINDGGRELIRASVEADPAAKGWIRVTLGTCDFCAKEARGDHMKAGDANFPRHDHCGCVPEPQYEPGLKPEEQYVEKIANLLRSGEATEDQLRAALLDPNTKPLSKVNIQAALDRVAEEAAQEATERLAAEAAVKAAEEVVEKVATEALSESAEEAVERAASSSALSPEALQEILDPSRRRTAAAVLKDLEATPEGKDLGAAIKQFTETRGGVANLRKNLAATLDGTASDTVAKRAGAFLDAMNSYPTDAVPELYRGIAVKVEENTAAWWDAFEGQFQPGQRFTLNASSFSSSEKKAAEFQSMIGGTRRAGSNHTAVRYVLEDGASALPVENLSKFRAEKEWITGGEYEVVDYTPASTKQPYYRVVIRQINRLGATT